MQDLLFAFISKYISLTEDEKNAIISLNIFHPVKKGATLLKAGQKTKENYFVLKETKFKIMKKLVEIFLLI